MKKINIKDFIKIPAGAQHALSWAKGVELERAFFNHSTDLCTALEKAVTESTEGATEALTKRLQDIVNKVCSDTFKSNQNLLEENIPEWVTLAKGQINDILAIKVNTWWTEMVNYDSSSKKTTATKALHRSVYFKLKSGLWSMRLP